MIIFCLCILMRKARSKNRDEKLRQILFQSLFPLTLMVFQVMVSMSL